MVMPWTTHTDTSSESAGTELRQWFQNDERKCFSAEYLCDDRSKERKEKERVIGPAEHLELVELVDNEEFAPCAYGSFLLGAIGTNNGLRRGARRSSRELRASRVDSNNGGG